MKRKIITMFLNSSSASDISNKLGISEKLVYYTLRKERLLNMSIFQQTAILMYKQGSSPEYIAEKLNVSVDKVVNDYLRKEVKNAIRNANTSH